MGWNYIYVEGSGGPSQWSPRLRVRFGRVGFVVGKVALEHFYFRVRLSSVSIIPPWPSVFVYHVGCEQ
jgi:uncharacterized membrane protein YciS (DUF1049 family)